MVGAPKKSPIDTLLKQNLKMAGSSSDASRRPVVNIKTKSEFLMPRTKRFGNKETTYCKSREVDTDREIGLIESSMSMDSSVETDIETTSEREEDRLQKERLLERLRHLGLAPHKYTAKKNTSRSTNKRKSQIPRRLLATYEDCFVQPRVFECDFCPKLFFHQKLFRRHTIKHLSHRKCTRCNKPFKCAVTLRRHLSQCKKFSY